MVDDVLSDHRHAVFQGRVLGEDLGDGEVTAPADAARASVAAAAERDVVDERVEHLGQDRAVVQGVLAGRTGQERAVDQRQRDRGVRVGGGLVGTGRAGEDGRQVAAGPFQIGVFQADREGHFGFDAIDAEQREHGDAAAAVHGGLDAGQAMDRGFAES